MFFQLVAWWAAYDEFLSLNYSPVLIMFSCLRFAAMYVDRITEDGTVTL